MSITVHQRPGVYSSYDASAVVSGRGSGRLVGLAAVNTAAQAGTVQTVTSYDQAVKALEAGREDVEIGESGCGEVRRLGRSIASMVSTMRHLMDDIIRQEEQKRRSELEVLQSQINPHFLYNTLDSVVWMTECGRTQEAIQMVTSLARLFRIALSRAHHPLVRRAGPRPALPEHTADPL